MTIMEKLSARISRAGGGGSDDSGNRGGRGGNDRGNGGRKDGWPPRQNLLFMGLATLIMFLLISYFTQSMRGSTSREISYNRFVEMIEAGELEEVSIETDRIVVLPKEGVVVKEEDTANAQPQNIPSVLAGQKITYYTGKIEEDDTLTARLLEHGVKVSGVVPDSTTLVISFLATYVLPIVLMWGLLSILFRRMGSGGPLGVGKSTAKEYVQRETGVTFADVAGEDEAKESLEEVVDFLHNPQRYVDIGAKLWPARRRFHSSPLRDRTSLNYMSASAPPECVTCSGKLRRTRPVSSLSTRSTRSEGAGIPVSAAAMTRENRR